MGEAIASLNAGGVTRVVAGIGMSSNNATGWAAALAAVRGADAVVLALGTDRSVAGEGTDRKDIGLPGVQEAFALAVLSAAAQGHAPVTLLLVHNLPVSFEALLAPANATWAPPAAIVDAWAPTSHAATLAALLFGEGGEGGWGRSVLTVYPRAYTQAVALEDMHMTPGAGNPGRSYKYYTGAAGAPVVRFGEGLSGYSGFTLACASAGLVGGVVDIGCNVTHAGGRGGDEVLMVFHRPGADVIARVGGAHPLPLSALRDFARVAVGAGGEAGVGFSLRASAALAFTNAEGGQAVYEGTHYLDVWNGNTENVTVTVQVSAADAGVTRVPPRPF